MRIPKTNVKENYYSSWSTDKTGEDFKSQDDLLSDAYRMCSDPVVNAKLRARAAGETLAAGLSNIIGGGTILQRGFSAANEADDKDGGLPDDRQIIGRMKGALSAAKWSGIQVLMETQQNINEGEYKMLKNLQLKTDANIRYIDSIYNFEFQELQYGSLILGSIVLILTLYILIGL